MNYKQPLELDRLLSQLDILLRGNLPPFWASLIEGLLILIAVLAAYAIIALILIYAERKVTAFFQARLPKA